jgi:hypothetical protein
MLTSAQSGEPAAVGLLPSGFVENVGQWLTDAAFVARRGPVTVRAEPGGIALQCERSSASPGRRVSLARLTFEGTGGASWSPSAVGEPLAGVAHFLVGSDPSGWRAGVRHYASVEYKDVVPGVDVHVSWPAGRVPTLGFVVRDESALASIVMRVDGIAGVACNRAPDSTAPVDTDLLTLQLPASAGGVRLSAERVGKRTFRVSFQRGEGALPGTIELPLAWSTYLGGESGGEYVFDVQRAPDGCPVVVGQTRSPDFPVTPGVVQEEWKGDPPAGAFATDAFVTKVSADGSALVYSTFLGGTGGEEPGGLAVDGSGVVTIVGLTAAEDFPTTPGAYDPKLGDIGKAFISQLSPDGTQLIASTFLGGNDGGVQANDVALTADGRIVVCGETTSDTFPTTPSALQQAAGGYFDGFISVLDPTLSQLLYSTYVGGEGDNRATALAVREDGSIVVTGFTFLPGVPLTLGAFSTELSQSTSTGFALALDGTTMGIQFGTYLGPCSPRAIAAHADGSVVVVGRTPSASFPTTPGAYDTTYNQGGTDGFVMRLDATGGALVYSTYLGGASLDDARDVVLDSAGRATVAGSTWSGSFPITAGTFPWPPVAFGPPDFFVTRLEPDGSGLLYSTYFGGPEIETSNNVALALDETGAAFVAGGTTGGFPVTEGAFDTTEPVIFDATVSLLTLLPTGASRFGASTPGTAGPLAIGVTDMPSIGTADFALTCTSAPASSTEGLLVLGFGGLSSPLVGKGVDVWVDPLPVLFIFRATSNADGYAVVTMPLPNDPRLIGIGTTWQFVWAPDEVGGPWSASNALAVVIQA